MPGSTPIYGFPYPLGSDPVKDGDNVIQSLATDVENQMLTNVGNAALVKIGSATFTNQNGIYVGGFVPTYKQYLLFLDIKTTTATTCLLQAQAAKDLGGGTYSFYNTGYTGGGTLGKPNNVVEGYFGITNETRLRVGHTNATAGQLARFRMEICGMNTTTEYFQLRGEHYDYFAGGTATQMTYNTNLTLALDTIFFSGFNVVNFDGSWALYAYN